MSNRKSFRPLFGLVGLVGILPLLTATTIKANSGADFSKTPARQTVKLDAPEYSFTGETAISSDKLDVSVVSSNVSSSCHSLTITFSTGGQGFADTTGTFLIAPTEEEFTTFYKEFTGWTSEYKKEIDEKAKNGEYETPHYSAVLYSLTPSAENTKVYIPASLSRGVYFTLDVVGVRSNAVTDWTNAEAIYIPSSIEDIYEDSFEGVPNTVKFYVEAESDNTNWAAGWNHGASVIHSANFPSTKHDVKSAAGAPMYGDKENNYVIGWYPKEGTQYPLIAEYKVKKVDGSLSETKYFEFEKSTFTATTAEYDGVGYKVFGYANNLYADIMMENPGESIDLDTVKIHNIFDAVGQPVKPDTDNPYYSVPHKSLSKSYNLSDFVTYKFTGISTFQGFTAVDILMDQSGVETYKLIKSNFYKQYEPAMKRGTAYIRYRITSLNSCYYVIQYKDGGEIKTEKVKIDTPVSQFVLNADKNNTISFMLKNSDFGKKFSAKSIYSLSFEGFYITLDIFAKTDTSNGPVARSNVTERFGYVAIMPAGETYNVFDANLLIILLVAIYVVLYIAAAVFLFFYFTNKFKNDEFRRVKPRAFLIKSLLGLAGSVIVILAVTFTILRISALNNAIVVYNPVDAYIIIFGVLSVLVVGYFSKYLVATYKASKQRKRAIKLKLNEDVADDGTK